MIERKIFVGIPSRDEQINKQLVLWLMNMSNKISGICIKSGQPTDTVRNFIVDRFLETECDWLLFIDDDMIPPNDLLNMLQEAEENNYYIFSPINLIHQENQVKNNIFGAIVEVNENLIQVGSCGCGCVFIHRKVFEAMEQPYFQFVIGDYGELKVSENINFTNKASEAGFYCFIDKRYKTNHLKKIGLMEIENVVIGYECSKCGNGVRY